MILRIRPARLAWRSKKANCRVQERGVEILHWRSRGTGQGRTGQGRAGQGREGMLIQTSGEDEWVAGRRVGSRPPRASVQRRFLIRSLARGSPPPTQEREPSPKTGRPQDIFR